jgi:protein-S-isoprenylcysteine O-methyltransferase Ste14
MASDSGRIRVDIGRIAMVLAAVVVLLLDLMALAGRGGGSPLRWAGALLAVAFYSLVIWCYLRRGPARATIRSITARAAAVAATWFPFVIPWLHGAPPGAVQQGVSDVLLLAGTAWAVWSLRSLGRNLSVIAQARDVADGGPYRWIRHPLYAGEIVSTLGLAIAAHSLAAIAVWLGICALQAYRAVREEQLLLAVLPGYGA